MGGFRGAFFQKGVIPCFKQHLFDKKAPLNLPCWKKIAIWPIGSLGRHSQLYFEPKMLGMGPKLSLLKTDTFHFFEAWNDTFLIKKVPQKPPLKNLHFDLLDHQVDTLSFILSQKF